MILKRTAGSPRRTSSLEHRASKSSAFTLLEVMLAIAIFALVAVPLAIALNKTFDASNQIRREDQIRSGLSSLLAEARQKPLKPGREALKPDSYGVTYETDVGLETLKNDDGALLTFYNLTVRARWKEGRKEEKRETELLLYQQ